MSVAGTPDVCVCTKKTQCPLHMSPMFWQLFVYFTVYQHIPCRLRLPQGHSFSPSTSLDIKCPELCTSFPGGDGITRWAECQMSSLHMLLVADHCSYTSSVEIVSIVTSNSSEFNATGSCIPTWIPTHYTNTKFVTYLYIQCFHQINWLGLFSHMLNIFRSHNKISKTNEGLSQKSGKLELN